MCRWLYISKSNMWLIKIMDRNKNREGKNNRTNTTLDHTYRWPEREDSRKYDYT